MKKTLSLLALATVLTSISTMASAADLIISNNSRGAINVTTFELDLDQRTEKEKDRICIPQGSMVNFRNYTASKTYKVDAEFKSTHCGSSTLDKGDINVKMNDSQVRVEAFEFGTLIIK